MSKYFNKNTKNNKKVSFCMEILDYYTNGLTEEDIEDEFCVNILDMSRAGYSDSEIAIYFNMKEKDISDKLISITAKSVRKKAKKQNELRSIILESADKFREELEQALLIAKQNGDVTNQIKVSSLLLEDRYDIINIMGLSENQINTQKLTEAQIQNYNAKKRKTYAEVEYIKSKTNDLIKNGSKPEINNFYIGKPVEQEEIDNDIMEYIKNQ